MSKNTARPQPKHPALPNPTVRHPVRSAPNHPALPNVERPKPTHTPKGTR
jgi:hypothetical protein